MPSVALPRAGRCLRGRSRIGREGVGREGKKFTREGKGRGAKKGTETKFSVSMKGSKFF